MSPCALALLVALAQAPAGDPLLAPLPPAARQLASWEEAVALFERRSSDLRVAAAEVARAQGQRRTALAALLPTLDGTAQASFSLLPAPAGLDPTLAASLGFGSSQALSLAATLSLVDLRTWNALAQAADAERAAALSLDDARRLLLLDLAQALLTAVTSERVAELARAGLRDALERLQLTERSSRAGAGSELDVSRARQDVEVARSPVVTGDEAVRRAREALGLALGLAEQVGVTPGFQLDGLADRVAGRCRTLASLEARADVLAARARVDVAERGALGVKAQFLPTLGVRSTAQLSTLPGTASASLLPSWNLLAVLSVPLWDGGARYGGMRAADAVAEQARAREDQVGRAARVDLDRARRGVEVAETARLVAARALEHASRSDQLVRRSFEGGLGTSLELVTAAAALRQQQLTLALREYDVLRARVAALFALAECGS
jgi:outer membrane protein, multidrug efflux system